jgi:acetyl-CoA synthetase (ADP-forming)
MCILDLAQMAANNLIALARTQQRTSLDEQAGKSLLASYGIAVPQSLTVKSASEVDAAFTKLTPPVVVKIMSPDILHKSDAGGVKVGLQSASEVKGAITAMAESPQIKGARIDGYLIEEMAPAGQEIVIGGLRDPNFGPLVMVGLGGIFVEVLRDVSFRICPITRIDAEEMIDDLKGAAILAGARGRKPASRAAIIDALLKVGGDNGLLMTHADDIQEADINPMIVSENGAVAVDARFILS